MAVFLVAAVLLGVLPIVFRAKGTHVFTMLCVGKALMEVSYDEVGMAARMVLNSNLPIDDIARVTVMLVPAVLTLFVTKKAAKKKFPYHSVPAISGGLLAGFWSVSQLTDIGEFETSTTYSYVRANVTIILLVGIVSSLFVYLLERPKPAKPGDDEKNAHHK